MLNKKKLLFLLFIGLTKIDAHALNLQGYRFSDSYRYSLLDDSLKEKFEGDYVITASFGHVHSPFYYSDTYLNDLKEEIIKYNNVLTAGYTHYLNENLSLGIDLNAINNSVLGETYVSLADTVLKAKYNFYRDDSLSFSINPQVFVPTGRADNFSTMGSVSGSLSAVAEARVKRVHLLASLGALSSKNNVHQDVDHRQLLLSQLGASYDLTEKMNINLEVYRNFPMVNDTLQDEGKYFLTAKHKTHQNFSSYLGGGVTGFDEVERNTYSFFVGLKFHETPAPVVTSKLSTSSSAPERELEEAVTLPEMKDVYFAHDKSDFPNSELNKIDYFVRYFNDFRDRINSIIIEGYASRVGHPDYNMRLSKKRANTVKAYIIKQGVPEEIVSVVGYGDKTAQDPVVAKNRKVELIIK